VTAAAPATGGASASAAPRRRGAARAAFAEDVARCVAYATRRPRLRELLGVGGLWALAAHRLGAYRRDEAGPLLRAALAIPHALLELVARFVFGIHLAAGARIGPGLYIGHWGGIWVAPGVVIGRHCNLSQGVTLGVGGTARRGTPVVGERVWIGPGACASGPIRVGDGAVVGANSLVVADVPARAVVVGVPARVVARSGSAALIG
jgi:serine O-acetyltransferase